MTFLTDEMSTGRIIIEIVWSQEICLCNARVELQKTAILYAFILSTSTTSFAATFSTSGFVELRISVNAFMNRCGGMTIVSCCFLVLRLAVCGRLDIFSSRRVFSSSTCFSCCNVSIFLTSLLGPCKSCLRRLLAPGLPFPPRWHISWAQSPGPASRVSCGAAQPAVKASRIRLAALAGPTSCD